MGKSVGKPAFLTLSCSCLTLFADRKAFKPEQTNNSEKLRVRKAGLPPLLAWEPIVRR